MYKEDLMLSDGSLFYTDIHLGKLESNIEYQMRPYYSAFAEGWIYPIINATYMAKGPDESITHKFTNIK